MGFKARTKPATSLSTPWLILGVGVLASTSACSTIKAPCLAYKPTYQMRTVSMRGYGFVQMSEEKLVCTERAVVAAAD